MNKSYLQWAGGKGKALKHLLPIINQFEFATFAEPFVGAANVSLNVEAEQYIWNDLNTDLTVSHRQVISDTENYLTLCEQMFGFGFEEYYTFRDIFNERSPNYSETYQSALFQYLNKHGFNGLCRYNSKGKYNVPKGAVTKNPKKVPYQQIRYFAERFKDKVEGIYNEDFVNFIRKMNYYRDILIYCDPPYIPATASNFKYTAAGFDINDQMSLVYEAKNSHHNVLISNHWNEVSQELYKDADQVWTFPVQRTISRDGQNRLPVEECVVLYRSKT